MEFSINLIGAIAAYLIGAWLIKASSDINLDVPVVGLETHKSNEYERAANEVKVVYMVCGILVVFLGLGMTVNCLCVCALCTGGALVPFGKLYHDRFKEGLQEHQRLTKMHLSAARVSHFDEQVFGQILRPDEDIVADELSHEKSEMIRKRTTIKDQTTNTQATNALKKSVLESKKEDQGKARSFQSYAKPDEEMQQEEFPRNAAQTRSSIMKLTIADWHQN